MTTRSFLSRLALYYAVLWVAVYFTGAVIPQAAWLPTESLRGLFGGVPTAQEFGAPAPSGPQAGLGLTVAVSMIAAALLSLPIAWVYTLTRAKRGYQQSVVQTLIVLPIVVAGVVVLVKYSLALAFALAGIVAAVRFRNTLEDSKDAVYIFLATALGLAAAVDLPVAVVISMVFNGVVLSMWYSDFGRTAGQFEGAAARRRLQRAKETMTQTGTFVARVDRDLMQDMTAEQLDALAVRAKKRARELMADSLGGKEAGVLRVRTYDVETARRRLETVLDDRIKDWELAGISQDPDGANVLEYRVRLGKNVRAADVLEVVRTTCAPQVVGAELD